MSNICIYIPDPNILTQSKVNREFTLIHRHLCYLEAVVTTLTTTTTTSTSSTSTTSTTTTTTTTLSLLAVSNKTTSPITVLTTDSGKVITDFGSAVSITFNLPAGTVGLHYFFANTSGQTVTIKANGTNTITTESGESSPGGTTSNGVSLTYIHLVCIATGTWISIGESTGNALWAVT